MMVRPFQAVRTLLSVIGFGRFSRDPYIFWRDSGSKGVSASTTWSSVMPGFSCQLPALRMPKRLSTGSALSPRIFFTPAGSQT